MCVAMCSRPLSSSHTLPNTFVTPTQVGPHETNRTCCFAVRSQASYASYVFNTGLVETLVGPGLRRDDEQILFCAPIKRVVRLAAFFQVPPHKHWRRNPKRIPAPRPRRSKLGCPRRARRRASFFVGLLGCGPYRLTTHVPGRSPDIERKRMRDR